MKSILALVISVSSLMLHAQEKGTFTDRRDGRVYGTIKVGTQTWMFQNLKKFNTGGWCYDDIEANCNSCGRLYNWETAKKVCPEGWHLPSKEEFETLFLVSNSHSLEVILNFVSCGMMTSKEPWGNVFIDFGALWTSTEKSSSEAWVMRSSGGTISYDSKKYGLSVRCISDYTNEKIPTISTNSITNVNQNSATGGGYAINDGGASITARGVCWSTSKNPTVENRHTTDGTGIGTFISSISDLKANNTYYIRAYATNNEITAYGNELSFTTMATITNCGTITDADGNIYNTVIIGSQCWMSENLKTTKFRNGIDIPNVTDNLKWAKQLTGAYCNYNNNLNNIPIYGRLYNWYAATDLNGLCPIGWHVPTHNEWTTLERALSTSEKCTADFPYDNFSFGWRGTDEGVKLRETVTTYWNKPNNATNSSGFNAIASGDRYINGAYDDIGHHGYWWTSSTYDSLNAWYRNFNNKKSGIYRKYVGKTNGFSVRCVKD